MYNDFITATGGREKDPCEQENNRLMDETAAEIANVIKSKDITIQQALRTLEKTRSLLMNSKIVQSKTTAEDAMTPQEIKRLLEKQLQLLFEKSKEAPIGFLPNYTSSIVMVATAIKAI